MDLPYTDAPFVVKLYYCLINNVFPIECLHCGREGDWLCTDCQHETILIQMPTCPFCDRLSPLGKTCSRCKKSYLLTGGRSVWYYQGPVVSAIQRYKYQSMTGCLDFFLSHVMRVFQEIPLGITEHVIITSVPSHKERLYQHGYNQSELIAQALAQRMKLPYTPLLHRKNSATSQTKLSRQERLLSVKDQFSLLPNATDISKTSVVIIDDVITTGATLSVCAAALKAAGAKRVWAITLAKD